MLSVLLVGWGAQPALGATVSGQVTSDGTAVSGAFVSATGPSGNAAGVASSDGSFTLSVPDGTYRLAANAPGFSASVADGVAVSGPTRQDLALSPSGASLRQAPIFGGATTVVADGTPGVFYASGGTVGGLYRTTEYGGTWTQVDTRRDDPGSGLTNAQAPLQVVTSGYPGEVAVSTLDGPVSFSTDYGVTWQQVANSPAVSNELLWGHAGDRSVLLDVGLDANGNNVMYVADMTSPEPSFVQMTNPYGRLGNEPEWWAVGDGVDHPWLATLDGTTGEAQVYPLVASASAPSPVVTVSGFPKDAVGLALGGKSAPGSPPSVLLAGGNNEFGVSVKDPGARSYPAPTVVDSGTCSGWGNFGASVAPDSGGGYAAGWATGCFIQDVNGAVSYKGGYQLGAVFDAGYNATDTSDGTDAVLMLGPSQQTATNGLPNIAKIATVNGGWPALPSDPIAVAAPGTSPGSDGQILTGITAATVHQTMYAPDSSSEIVAASDAGGAVSTDGGATFHRASFGDAWAVAAWKGASGNWLLLGQNALGSNPDLLAGFLNWSPSTPPAAGGNVTGSSSADLADSGNGDNGQYVEAIAGVPGQDTAFLGVAPQPGVGAAGTGVIRVSVNPGPSLSDEFRIGDGKIIQPGPLGYCPTTGSASSLQDVLLVIDQGRTHPFAPRALYRITNATGDNPVVTKILDLPAPGQLAYGIGGGLPALKVDCASGTVWAASGAPGAGLLNSTDGGQSFTTVPVDDPSGAGNEMIRAIAIAPGDPQSLMVGDANGYIQTSTDGGQTWTLANDPTTDINLSSNANLAGGIWDLALPPATPAAASIASNPPTFRRTQDLIAGAGEFLGVPRTRAIPLIRDFKLTHARFVVTAHALTAWATALHEGSAFTYRLSLPAIASITIYRKTRAKTRLCPRANNRNAPNRHCTRVGTVIHWSRAGKNKASFTGKLNNHWLSPGGYIATITARIGTGPQSNARIVDFTILRT
jgi:hypothetical protein